MNILESYEKRAKQKYGTLAEGIRFINTVCGTSISWGHYYDMKRGMRNVPASVQRLLINEVLLSELENAGFDMAQGNFEMLRDSLSLPQRVNK